MDEIKLPRHVLDRLERRWASDFRSRCTTRSVRRRRLPATIRFDRRGPTGGRMDLRGHRWWIEHLSRN